MSLYPENPAGQVYQVTSQDTFASAGAPLSVVGSGGGGGPVPANLVVSTLTAADTVTAALLILNGPAEKAIEVGTDVGLGGSSQYIAFNSAGQDTQDAGQLAIFKSETSSVSNPGGAAGLAIFALSTNLSAYQPVACSDIYILDSSADNSDGRLAFALEAKNTPVSSLNIQAPNVNISSLIGVSSINGVVYVPLQSNIGVQSLSIALANSGFGGNITLIGDGNTVGSFGTLGWNDTVSGSFSNMFLDVREITPFAAPPGLGTLGNGGNSLACIVYHFQSAISTCPITVSGTNYTPFLGALSTPTIYANANASTLILAATSSISFNTNSLGLPANLSGVSSINGVNWDTLSTLAGGV